MRSQLEQTNCRGPRAAARRRWPNLEWFATIIALSLAFLGCGCNDAGSNSQTKPATPADPDDVPITEADVPVPASYAEAVERLVGYRDAIRQAVESGHLSEAHRPLDETNIAIERLPAVARASGVPRRQWEQVVTASEDLGEALDEIHTEIDAGRKPDYAAHAKAIDNALTRLKAILHIDGQLGSTE
jgi:FAD/FMN-containing dehydrogenase